MGRNPNEERLAPRIRRLAKPPNMLEALYARGRKVHRSLYDRGVLRRRRLAKPVICVGNVSVGGTGKTPFLIELVNELKGKGVTSAVLSRGYRAVPPAKTPRIVSDRERILCAAPEAGDEPLLIANRCPGTPVIIGRRRYESGVLAGREFDPDLFILDDGFQHEALERDLDIVLWDYRDVPSECRQLPAGRLREDPHALARAGAIVLTHAEYVDADRRQTRRDRVRSEVEALAPGVPLFEAASELGDFYELGSPAAPPNMAAPLNSDGSGDRPTSSDSPASGASPPAPESNPASFLLLSGLARPEGFESMVRALGSTVAGHLSRGDHARYDAAAVGRIRQEMGERGADRILTTEKDAVKLSGLDLSGLSVWVAPISLRVVEREAWAEFIENAILPLVENRRRD